MDSQGAKCLPSHACHGRVLTTSRPKAIETSASVRQILALVFVLIFAQGAGAQAQDKPLESFFQDAQRFLEKQGKKLQRELNNVSNPPASASRPPALPPPLPLINPNRGLASGADKVKKPVAPVVQLPTHPAPKQIGRPTPPEISAPRPVELPVPPVIPVPRPVKGALSPVAAATALPLMPLPLRKPAKPEAARTPEATEPPPHPSTIEVADWTEQQIELARNACASVLKGHSIKYTPLAPIREGVCGAPYPIKVTSIGSDPAVSLVPAATMTCEMAVALHRWLGTYVQKAAQVKLGVQVVQIRNAASYSCRNRNNNPQKRISEHALANALDISAFITTDGTKGMTISVLKDWAEKDAGRQTSSRDNQPLQQASSTPLAAITAPQPELEVNQPALTSGSILRMADGASKPEIPTLPAPESTSPQRPAPATLPVKEEEEKASSPQSAFLRAIHASACITFGTVLGPEADESHRDHFHLDAAKRRYGNYCR